MAAHRRPQSAAKSARCAHVTPAARATSFRRSRSSTRFTRRRRPTPPPTACRTPTSCDSIRVVGAREHNPKAEPVAERPEGPNHRVPGVSGSGKSSLVFDTIGVEAQRQLNATFPG